MNESPSAAAPGVYVALPDLIVLAAAAAGSSLVAAQPPSSVLAGRRASRLRGRGLSFDSMREYRAGDDVRRIDWRVSARTAQPHLRLYAEERERPVMLVVDQRMNMFFGTRVQMKSVTAAELAAVLAWQVVAAGDRVGAVVFDDGQAVEIEPRRNRRTVLRILGELVRANRRLTLRRPPTPASGQLDATLEGLARRATSDWMVVIVSDFYGIGEATRRLVRRLARHNDVVAAFVHDPVALALPVTGRRVLGDGWRQAELDLSDPVIRQAIAQTTHARQTFLGQIRRELEVPCLAIDTTGDVPRQLARALGQGR